MPVLYDRVLDLGLNVLDTEATTFHICSAETTTFGTLNSLGNKTLAAGDIGGGRGGARNRDAASRWLEIERARLKREKARRRSAEKAIADALKDPPKAAQGAAVAVADLSDGARVTLAALLDGMAPQTATVIADQVDALLSASQDAAKPRREIEAAREWIAEVQAVLDEQARIQAEDDEVLLLLLAA